MIDFVVSITSWLLATLVPAFLGLTGIILVGSRVGARYTAAFGLGIFLWFFLDTISGSASLDVNDGFTGGWAQAGVVILFTVGLFLVFWYDRSRNIFSVEGSIGKYGLIIPLLVAVSIGIHGLGEGTAFGSTTASTSSTTLLDAFGGLNAGIAYVLHKALEPMMIGACYCVYSGKQAKSARDLLSNLGLLSVVFVIPSLLGAATRYILGYDASYFFALGAGTSVYAAIRLAAPLFRTPEEARSRESMRLAIALFIGFIAIYIAALFHS
jgi:zinc transporter ZupT